MRARIITTIPVYNGEAFIAQTLDSVASQTLRPDRVVVLDNCSTDRTAEIVKNFTAIKCEYIRNEKNLGLFGNMNRCLEFSTETEFLHMLHADDLIEPEFYAVMTAALDGGNGLAMGWCLDERIDENNQHLSFSGKTDGKTEVLLRDTFLKWKAELGNQAFCATLLKTSGEAVPVCFREDLPIMGDTMFWAAFGVCCQKIVHVRRALGKYRWHGSNETTFRAPTIKPLVLDEWLTMESNESLRECGWGALRDLKLKALFAVRSRIKAKRVLQNGNKAYAREISATVRPMTGNFLWLASSVLVELRDFYLFKIQRRTRHPKNIYG